MALAETARLITELSLKDQLSGGLARARGELTKTDAASGAVARSMGGLNRLTAGASGAFNTFTGRVGQLAGSAGLLGLGAGLFSIGHLMGEGIAEARDFGREVNLLAAVTGLTTEKTSELAGVFHHFGIETDTALRLAGFAEKNLFKLGGTAKQAADFQAKYGLALVDSSGTLKDFNTLLIDSSNYFNNKNIPAAQKAAALASIYGRNWQAIIPVLKAGGSAIADVEQEAKDLGLTLNSQNLADLTQLKEATRSWNTALAGLKLQIGLALVPALKDLATAATNFLRNGGRQQIVDFFKQMVGFGRQAADVINNQVIPVFKGIYGAWMAVPKELRDLILTGLVANKTVKFLFGFSPLDLGKDILGGLSKMFLGRGSTPANPLFVADVAGGLGGGLGGGAAGGALKGAAMGVAKYVIGPVAAVVIGSEIAKAINEPVIGPVRDAEKSSFDRALKSNNLDKLKSSLDAIDAQLNSSDPTTQLGLIASRIPIVGDALSNVAGTLEQQRAQLRTQIAKLETSNRYTKEIGDHNRMEHADLGQLQQAARVHTSQIAALHSSERADAAATRGAIYGQSGYLARIANKAWVANVTTNVSVSADISVDTLTRRFISSTWATSGRAPGSIL